VLSLNCGVLRGKGCQHVCSWNTVVHFSDILYYSN
jgi:hypothetical protein